MDAYNRQQFNIKIDHTFNQKHRLSGTWVRESHYTDNNNLAPWPTGWFATGGRSWAWISGCAADRKSTRLNSSHRT